MMLYSKKKRKFYGIRTESFLWWLCHVMVAFAMGMFLAWWINVSYGVI